MGFFSFLNPITAPFGIKLGGGGPYADGGAGDLQKQQLATANQRNQMLASHGQLMMDGPGGDVSYNPMNALWGSTTGMQNEVNGGLTPLQGLASGIPDLLRAYAQTNNISPDTGGNADPYALLDHQKAQLGQGVNQINQQRQNAMSTLQASLAQRGIQKGDSAYDSAMQRISDHFDSSVNDHTTNFMESVRKNKSDALGALTAGTADAGKLQMGQQQQRIGNQQTMAGQYQSQIGQGAGLVSGAANGALNAGSQYAQIGQNNSNNYWAGISNLFGAAGAAAGMPSMPKQPAGGASRNTDTVGPQSWPVNTQQIGQNQFWGF